MPTATVRDATFYYNDEGAGDPVLFIHGLTWDHTLWDHQVAALKDSYRCIAVDLIGHGQTPDVDHEYSFFDLADYMAAFLRAVGAPSAHIVGLSMGGMTAMPMALEHPHSVKSLVLVDTDAQPESPEKVAAYGQLGQAVLAMGWQAVAEPVANILFGAPYLSDPARKAAVLEKLAANDMEAVAGRALRTVTNRVDVLDRLGIISVPVTVIVGELDIATTPDRAEAMAAAIPGAKLVRIPGTGHHSPLENPEAVTAALREHLARAK
jgi:pimeloyl-ACP methyl ester carboxylesterase